MSFLQTEYLSKLLESQIVNSLSWLNSTFNFETMFQFISDWFLEKYHEALLWAFEVFSNLAMNIEMWQGCQINANICFPERKIQRVDQHIFPFLAKYFVRIEAPEMFILYRVSWIFSILFHSKLEITWGTPGWLMAVQRMCLGGPSQSFQTAD